MYEQHLEETQDSNVASCREGALTSPNQRGNNVTANTNIWAREKRTTRLSINICFIFLKIGFIYFDEQRFMAKNKYKEFYLWNLI